MPGSTTTPSRPDTCGVASRRIAFHVVDRVGARKTSTYAAQWLACTYPYRRFAAPLAESSARLGADADRYSFIVMDFHHLISAGLPALRQLDFPVAVVGPLGLGDGHTSPLALRDAQLEQREVIRVPGAAFTSR
jgi:hypothetical protein